MPAKNPVRIKTITEGHRMMGLSSPQHPLISVLDYADLKLPEHATETSVVFDFYYISMKKGFSNKLFYGQQTYDFDEGMLYFIAPNQVFRGAGPSPGDDLSGWVLLVHPDLLWGTTLAKTIAKYEFFDYSVHEALFVSEKEKVIVNTIIENIAGECNANLDKFSHDIIISHVETLLNYAERFYQRQFLTRKVTNHKTLDRLEELLHEYFSSPDLAKKGMPAVTDISDRLNVSASYLSGLLKTLTGQSTQQHIQNKAIEKAKEKLSTTDLSVSEIAYELGFEYPQSFSKLFKKKTNLSPQAFRSSFG